MKTLILMLELMFMNNSNKIYNNVFVKNPNTITKLRNFKLYAFTIKTHIIAKTSYNIFFNIIVKK